MTRDGHEATTFVGRRHELDELHQALASARSITLIGIGGAGKTRLAQRLVDEAADALDGLDGRVWLVDLGQLHDPGMVQVALAAAMGIRPKPGERQVATICDFLGEEPAVLVLDNCEHLLPACAALVPDLLSACPALRVVATSRQALGIAGEVVYRVPPLPVPDLSRPVTAQSLAECESVALFVDRARHALPGFELNDKNAESVARLCVALEGLPLALELAAARSRVLSPEAMLTRIEHRYHLLSRGYVDLPDRHRSMEASVAWSHELCTHDEQVLWARLSVFTGGFDLDAAELVCTDDELPADRILDVLSSLADKSLVARDPGDAVPHFRMLETIRQYGAARLEVTGDADVWARRHQDHFAAESQRFHERWVGPDQPELMERLRRNHGNLRSVLERTTAGTGDAVVALRMTTDLEDYWAVTGLLTEARHWFDAALAHGTGSPVERATALSISGYLAGLQTDLKEAAGSLRAARVALESGGPEPAPPAEGVDRDEAERARTVAWARLRFAEGVQALYTAEVADAEDSCRRSIALFRSVGELHGLPAAYVVLGVALSAAGRTDEAAAVHAEGLALTTPRGELHIRGLALWALSVDARKDRDLERAEELAGRSLDLRWRIGDDAGVALALESLASISAERREANRSATLLGAAMRLWDRVGLDPLAGQYIAAQREVGEEAARAQLGDSAFVAAHRRGRSLPVDQAVAYALARGDEAEPGYLADTPLTARERQVADLIGEGLSNQQIATRLVISVRTAQGHVENILRKLGFSSRTQVAAWVVARRTGAVH